MKDHEAGILDTSPPLLVAAPLRGFHGMIPQFVGRPLDHTPFDAGTGHPDTETK